MDPEEFRAILSRSGVGIWAMIEAAIGVASSDYGDELRRRRDKIVESLYAPAAQLCRSCNGDVHQNVVQDEQYYPQNITTVYNNSDDIDNNNSKKYNNDDDNTNEDFSKSPSTPESNHRNFSGGEEEEDLDPYGGLFDDEQTKIVTIKEQLEDPNQSEDAVVDLLQNLADMDITFQALKVPDFGYSPNPQNGRSSVERNYAEHEPKPRPPQSAPRREAPSRPPQSVPKSASAPPNRAQREPVIDDERLNSARRRLQENYQEAQNGLILIFGTCCYKLHYGFMLFYADRVGVLVFGVAKKQRTIQVMDIHEIPKPKNAFFAKNKGGFQGRHHR
ncbi:putative mediator of RNA polymerase II transcription subunitc [Sesamum angolense]|uniref:Mediator of RNA polymerase II transcription subunitc n=1 Tax=Sesamum angolense TaxID=2727404 RepID=A0AAE1XGQ2_9LAMI|nr:putative mediator of RNA polymerase II transcription subunitc [Sesamum angolense]